MSYFDLCMLCEHREKRIIEKDDDIYHTCKAFPDGIPMEIYKAGKHSQKNAYINKKGKLVEITTAPHYKVVKGQVGDYVFELIKWTPDE